MFKIIPVFGTRPEAVKMAPVVLELKKHSEFDTKVIVTAQHRGMLDQVLSIFNIKPDIDLDIMKDRQTLTEITSRSIVGLDKAFKKEKPDLVLVHGDTTTTFAASLAAFYNKIPVGHVEAGLRTFDKYYPFPEEINRKLTGVLTELHFAPTKTNEKNLLNEGVPKEKIFITGNTVIDALKLTVLKDYTFKNKVLRETDYKTHRIIAVTAHRRENLGKPLENICLALKKIAEDHKDTKIIYPVHLNPLVQETARNILGDTDRIVLTEPVDVQDMHNLLDKSYLVLTDSGGLQEEVPSLGKPVLVLRNETERPEAVEAGTVKLAGTDKENIYNLASQLLNDDDEYNKMSRSINPYGDGLASQRIAKSIKEYFSLISD
jgi:UDP-N-acetylglucosamine 2-epimerase (non-hydrolysing)